MELWLDYIKYGWPVLTGIGAFLVIVASLWLNTRFVSRAEHAKLAREVEQRVEERRQQIAELNERLHLQEVYQKEPPTRHDLGDGLTRVLERMSKLEATVESSGKRIDREFDALGRQLGTLNDYLQAVIEKGLGR